MPKLLLQYNGFQKDFFPLTLTRPFIDLRVGILTVADKWKRLALSQQIDIDIISENQSASADIIWDARLVPMNALDIRIFIDQKTAPNHLFFALKSPWDIIRHNTALVSEDIQLIKTNYVSNSPSEQVSKSGIHPFYVHPTALLEHCFVNTDEGPVLIDENAYIMQGAMLRGPLYIGKRTVVKNGSGLVCRNQRRQ